MEPDEKSTIRDLAGDDGELLTPLPTERPKRKRRSGPRLPTACLIRVSLVLAMLVLIAVVLVANARGKFHVSIAVKTRSPAAGIPVPSAPTSTPHPVTATPRVKGANLLSNGDFERDDFVTAPSWDNPSPALRQWVMVPGDQAAHAVQWINLSSWGNLVKVKGQAGDFSGAGVVQYAEAQAGTCYTLSADVFAYQRDAILSLDFLDDRRQRVAVLSETYAGVDKKRITVRGESPAGTRYIRAILYTGHEADGAVYWDNVELRECDSFYG